MLIYKSYSFSGLNIPTEKGETWVLVCQVLAAILLLMNCFNETRTGVHVSHFPCGCPNDKDKVSP